MAVKLIADYVFATWLFWCKRNGKIADFTNRLILDSKRYHLSCKKCFHLFFEEFFIPFFKKQTNKLFKSEQKIKSEIVRLHPFGISIDPRHFQIIHQSQAKWSERFYPITINNVNTPSLYCASYSILIFSTVWNWI